MKVKMMVQMLMLTSKISGFDFWQSQVLQQYDHMVLFIVDDDAWQVERFELVYYFCNDKPLLFISKFGMRMILGHHLILLFGHFEYHKNDIPKNKVRAIYETTCKDLLSSRLGIKQLTIAYSRPKNIKDTITKAKLHQAPGREASKYYSGELTPS